jgi:hypothetical protein
MVLHSTFYTLSYLLLQLDIKRIMSERPYDRSAADPLETMQIGFSSMNITPPS